MGHRFLDLGSRGGRRRSSDMDEQRARIVSLRASLKTVLEQDKELTVAGEDASKVGAAEIIVESSHGVDYAVELATGPGELHFGSIALIEDAITSREKERNQAVKALLVTNGPVTGNLRKVTDRLGMRQIDAAGMNSGALADAVVSNIKAELFGSPGLLGKERPLSVPPHGGRPQLVHRARR